MGISVLSTQVSESHKNKPVDMIQTMQGGLAIFMHHTSAKYLAAFFFFVFLLVVLDVSHSK